jgi:hypothetical protein
LQDIFEGFTPLELERALPPPEAEAQTSLSFETIERRYPKWVVHLSPRRKAIRLKHVLLITSGAATAT